MLLFMFSTERFPSWAKVLLVLLVLLLIVTGGLLVHFRHYFMSDCQVEVEEGEESVQLPFRTIGDLPEKPNLKWEKKDVTGWVMMHEIVNGSDQPGSQQENYRDRTEMKEALLKTGDLSLTLKNPTVRDTGTYRCACKCLSLLRSKTVLLKVKVRTQDKDETVDIRNRSSSTDPTPLMADKSV
ncbi:V-set domain-containing T-cell activation inhibitor 1 B7 -like protein 4 [Channa argus]|uniref:V-set domain-containing T-cell activation inhibitor 1 B7-like protein 4 n=1 Tax=Channa argus TaxID=215402 RepID=A0A6G1Q7U8_CHAAH|nr:V-set domain-containing T-cell activation inhibitor 1 B7 -like protein 4 [Channa argus]